MSKSDRRVCDFAVFLDSTSPRVVMRGARGVMGVIIPFVVLVIRTRNTTSAPRKNETVLSMVHHRAASKVT